MASTVMSIKTEKELKAKAQKLSKKLGFPLGTLINAFLRQFVRNKTVYFSMNSNKVMSKALEAELGLIENDIKNDKNLSPSFDEMAEALAYLKNK